MPKRKQTCKTFIVHLQRATGRKAQVQDLISKAPYETQIIDAVDGSKLSKSEIEACYNPVPLLKPDYPFVLNVGEMGCFLSHRKCWQEIVDQKLDAGLIFEDDVQINVEHFGPALALATAHVQDLGYIQFQVREVPDVKTVVAQDGSVKLVRPVVTPLRTSAQIVSFSTAQKLLELSQKFDRPIDGVLQLYWETDLHIACVVPSGVTDWTAATGGSTLSLKQPLSKKLVREFKRNRYKSQVQKFSRRTSGKIGQNSLLSDEEIGEREMAGVWRALTTDELTGGSKHEAAKFGTFAPNALLRLMIAIGKKSILKRGVFRGGYTRLILALSKGPLDIFFRGCAYRIWGENNLIEYGLLLNPNYNHADLDFLVQGAALDANFVDLGSNIGLYSQPMAKAGPKGKTISIDANPLMAARLKFNANASGLDNLSMVSAAVSDTKGQGSLVIRKDDVAIVAVEEVEGGRIPIRTLAAILAEHDVNSIYGLKIDIEGHEDKALVPFLMNAPKEQLPEKIVIEHPEPNADYPGCTEAFAKLNYKLVGRSRNNSFYELAI